MLTASISSSLLNSLHSLPSGLIYTVVFALVFGETALFIGFILPGETAVLVAGALASQGRANVVVLCGVVVAAAIVGNSVGYVVGQQFGERLIALRLFNKRRPTLERALHSIETRGATYVVIGRFTAILRAVMPALAGMSEMTWMMFTIANVISALVWGVAYTLLGYYAGHAIGHVEHVASGVAIAAFAAVVVIVLWRYLAGRRRRHGDEAWRTRED
jgi:membrane-associated protein